MPNTFCVFEALNRGLREAIIGVVDDCSLERLAAAHKKYPPVWMAKWEGAAEYRWVACSVSLSDARWFAETHAKSADLKTLVVHLVG